MAAMFHHSFDVRWMGRSWPMDFHPNFHPGIGGWLAAGDQRVSDLLQRLLHWYPLWEAIGADLDPTAPDVGRELHEFLARFNVLAHDGGIGGVELANAAAAPNFDPGISKALANF